MTSGSRACSPCEAASALSVSSRSPRQSEDGAPDRGAVVAGPGWLEPINSLLTPPLDDLDRELERRGHRFARYADDLLILVRSARAGERVKASITRYLTSRLKLRVNESKSRVCGLNEVVFLGFTFRGSKLRWSDEAFETFKHRVRRLT
ncbi:MAG: hypothetical protein GY719_34400, partial [bacterium]|nr:hypothetical protein [bacterium]